MQTIATPRFEPWHLRWQAPWRVAWKLVRWGMPTKLPVATRRCRLRPRRVTAGLLILLCSAVPWAAKNAASDELAGDRSNARVTLRGMVEGAAGLPLDVFQLIVFRWGEEPDMVAFREAAGVLNAETDTTVYAVAIKAPGHAPWFGRFRFVSGGIHDFGVISLPRERLLRGRVVDLRTGEPIAGAGIRYVPPAVANGTQDVRVLEHWAGASTTSDDDGRYTLRRLPHHDVQIKVSASGYAGQWIVLPADDGHRDIQLGVGATIEGVLTLPNGDAAGGTVHLSSKSDWRERAQHQLDSAGGFRFDHLRAGSYTLYPRSDAGVVEARTVTVAEDEHLMLELAVDPLGRLMGFVSGLTATQSVSVSVKRADGTFARRATASVGNGAFELNGFADGDYIVEADGVSFSLQRRVEVVGGLATVRFDFAQGSRLSGRVLAGERPLSGVDVEVMPMDGDFRSGGATSDSEGRFEMDRLDDGDYLARVRLGRRGTQRTFPVTVVGDTVFDVRLGPFRLSGKVLGEMSQPGSTLRGSSLWVNHVVQAKLLSASDEPVVFRDFVDSRGMYAFEGLEEGLYSLSHGLPYYGGSVREIAVFGGSVDGADFRPSMSETQPVRWLDDTSGQPVEDVTCQIHDGLWVGLTQWVEDYGLPTTLAGSDMTCSAEGFAPVRLRWDGEPGEIELKRAAR